MLDDVDTERPLQRPSGLYLPPYCMSTYNMEAFDGNNERKTLYTSGKKWIIG